MTTHQTFAQVPVDLVSRFTLQCMYAKLLLDQFLCGILLTQLVHYLKCHRRDRKWILGVVAGSSFVTFFLSVYTIRYVVHLFIDQFGKPTPLLSTTYLAWYPMLDALISSLVQCFFAHRCWRITDKSKIVTGLLAFLIVGSVVCASVMTWQVYTMESYIYIREARPTIILWLVNVVAADVMVTSAILYGLHKNRTGWQHTDLVIKRLARVTLEAQLPPTLCKLVSYSLIAVATTFLIVFLIKPKSDIHFIWQGVQSKLYVIGLLFSLNSREEFGVRNLTVTGSNVELDLGAITIDVETERFETVVDNPRKKMATVNRP